MIYPPIAEHGIIGDLHTVALVGTNGTIDWHCCPRFDSPSVFGSILDSERGGFYRIAPVDAEKTVKQFYFPDTNILITRFLCPDGVGEVQDFMPIHRDPQARRQLVRRVVCVRGTVRFALDCQPRFDYGRAEHELEVGANGALFRSPGLTLALSTETPLEPRGPDVFAAFTLAEGEKASFSLEEAESGETPRPLTDDEATSALRAHGSLLAGLAPQVAVPGPLARDGPPLRADAQAPHLPAHRRDRRRPTRASPRLGGPATGITATRGSATRRSRSTRCCASASPRRPRPSWAGSPRGSRSRRAAARGRSRSCTGSTAAPT